MDQLLSDPSKLGVAMLLGGALLAFYKGLVLARWTHDAMMLEKDKQITAAKDDCKYYREAHTRLLEQLERSVRVAEVTATTAEKAVARATK
jgi:hypothetical protein